MNTPAINILALVLSKEGGERIKTLVSTCQFVNLQGLESSFKDFEQKAVKFRPQALIVEYQPDNKDLIDLLETLRKSVPSTAVIALSSSKEPNHIIQALRLGIRDYLLDGQDTHRAFQNAVLKLGMPAESSNNPDSGIIGVLGTKGGVGTSHLAANLSWAWSQMFDLQVVLADMNLYGGNQAFLFDIEPTRDWAHVPKYFDRLDTVLMESLLIDVAPGFRLLPAPQNPVETETISPKHVSTTLELLAANNAVLVLDINNGLDETTLTAMDWTKKLLLVFEPTLMGLKATERMLLLCRRLGYEKDKVLLVCNRSDAKMSLKQREVESALNTPVLAWLPNDHLSITEADNSGRPVLASNPRSKWSKTLIQLASKMLKEKDK